MPLSLGTCTEPKKKPKVIWSLEGQEQESGQLSLVTTPLPSPHQTPINHRRVNLGNHALLYFYKPSPGARHRSTTRVCRIVEFEKKQTEERRTREAGRSN